MLGKKNSMSKNSCLAFFSNNKEVYLAEDVCVVKNGIVGAEQIKVKVRISDFTFVYYGSLYRHLCLTLCCL